MPIEVVEPRNVEKTGYAPGIRISADTDLLFLSGITARPLDLAPEEPFDFPEDIDEQAQMMFENIQAILDEVGITWQDIVKVVRFTTESGGGGPAQQYFQGWSPCSTSLGVPRLPLPGAKIMYDITAVVPA
jgi:enamine deaminase RidA (YjgF/YER057c/UK114 family)